MVRLRVEMEQNPFPKARNAPSRTKEYQKQFDTGSQFSQASLKTREYKRTAHRFMDPIWMLMKNPMFAEKINKLACASREKWNVLEMDKVRRNVLYKPVPCPLTLDALTWFSAYLRFYFLNQNADVAVNSDSVSDLERIFNVLIHHFEDADERLSEQEILEASGVLI